MRRNPVFDPTFMKLIKAFIIAAGDDGTIFTRKERVLRLLNVIRSRTSPNK